MSFLIACYVLRYLKYRGLRERHLHVITFLRKRIWEGTGKKIKLWMDRTKSVQSLSHVQHFVTPWTTAHKASLSITYSQSLPKLMSTELVIPSNHLILRHFLLLLPSIFHSIRVFTTSGSQSIGASASASVLPVNIQGRFPLGLTGLISLLSKGIWRVFSSTKIWKHQFFGTQPSLWSNLHQCCRYSARSIS